MLDAFFESYTCPTDVIIYKVSMVFLISNIDVGKSGIENNSYSSGMTIMLNTRTSNINRIIRCKNQILKTHAL